jgi:predicted O-methyltransferase YrrM
MFDNLLKQKNDENMIDLMLFTIALNINARQILEIGVRTNSITEAFLTACERTNGIVHSVDKQNRFVKNKRWIFNQSDTLEFIKNNRLIYDIIYIDGWHHGKHVLEQLTKLQHYIKPSGLILIPNTMWENPPHYYRSEETAEGKMGGGGPSVALFKFVHRSRFSWEYVTIPIDNGLTILRKVSEEQI